MVGTAKVVVVCGVPGCGKSTWIKRNVVEIEEDGYTTAVISRDAVRFGIISEGEDYFSHEDEVFDEFMRQINEAIELGINYVFVDATHISKASREKLLKRLRPNTNTELLLIAFRCSLPTILMRNAQRAGLARVPDSVVMSMYKRFKAPTIDETPANLYGFKSITIKHLKEDEY